jgi:hypothetical protein
VGLRYYRLSPTVLESLRSLILGHENDLVGPRARGYWFDRPDDYDYAGVQATARTLDEVGHAQAVEALELSEVQAHGLSLLDVELPADDLEFPPALFMSSASPAMLARHLKLAQRRLGNSPEEAAERFVQNERDPRFTAYLNKQVRHLREALPLVWHLYERGAQAGDAVLVVDLRARDLEIPEEVELASAY